jgi:hypothetical protein
MEYYYHTEIGTLNGYFRYMVVAENAREAANKALKLHKSKGRPILDGYVIKVIDKYDRAKTFYIK